MREKSKRQSFLGARSDQLLGDLRVGIVGLCGGGSHVVQQLAHIGVGNFMLSDPDRIEESNLNRLVGGTYADVVKKEWKVNIAARVIRSVNRSAKIITSRTRWQESAKLLRDCDVIFGCIDSFAGRDELESAARRFLTPYIDIGMGVHEKGSYFSITGQAALSMPGEACLHCMNILQPNLLAQEAEEYGAAGGKPQVVWPNGVLASMAVGIMMQLVTPWHDDNKRIYLLEYDGNIPEVRPSTAIDFLLGKRCSHFIEINNIGDPWYGNKGSA